MPNTVLGNLGEFKYRLFFPQEPCSQKTCIQAREMSHMLRKHIVLYVQHFRPPRHVSQEGGPRARRGPSIQAFQWQ